MTDRPTCTATNRAGNRCGRYPAIGATVCHFHGGAAPQVRRQAKRRRVDLVIHGRNGRIRSKDSYGNESPVRDTEH